MRVRTGFGETLPALLRRRFGVPERITLAGAAIVAAGLVAMVVLDDPLDGKSQRVHRAAPVFNTLYVDGLVEPAEPRGNELQRYRAGRAGLRYELTIRPFRLPAYRGEVSGILPLHAQRHVDGLARRLPGFRLLAEGRARVNTAPGYEVVFRHGRRSSGRDVFVLPPEQLGARDGVLISLRETRATRERPAAAKPVVKAMRTTFRSFKYGADRDD